MQVGRPELEQSRSARDASDASDPAGRALVPIQAPDAATRPSSMVRYPSASFLAHLIAVDRRAPQMRRRGRAAPGDAAALYRAGITHQTWVISGRICDAVF